MKHFFHVMSAVFVVAMMLTTPRIHAQSVSVNSGKLGPAGDGTHTPNITLGVPGPLAAPGDLAVSYADGARTTLPYHPALNPPAGSPFSIEFWAAPTASDNDDSPLANRIATGNRSGWAFFQRAPAVGWNFRMYDGNGSALGWDLTGGASLFNTWSHVVATWNGSTASLYVNGALADNTNDPGASGLYNASTAATFSVGALFDGGSPSMGAIDEVAFYAAALTADQIAGHFAAALSLTPGEYGSRIIADGAVLYWQNLPEPPDPLAGDIDEDGHVTRHDAALFARYGGMNSGSVWATGDFNGDEATTLADLALLQANLGQSQISLSPAAAVPEPSSAAIAFRALLTTIAALPIRKGRRRNAS